MIKADTLSRFIKEKKRNRFEHSLGVYLLLNKFNAPLEEQLAGLIHDVSHTVFSHTAEYGFNKQAQKQSHQDDNHENFVLSSSLPKIFSKRHLDINYILNDNNFPLKEKMLPDLCADRIDYVLRDAFSLGEIDLKGVNYFLNNLEIIDNNWVFKEFESAKKFTDFFFKLNNHYYSDLRASVMHQVVGDVVRYSLEKNYLSEKDLYTTDKLVLTKIKSKLSTDKNLKKLFDKMEGKINYKNNPKDYDNIISLKSRVIDPLFSKRKNIKHVSDIVKGLKNIIVQGLKPKTYYIKFQEGEE